MKAIKINATINLTSGEKIKSGAIVTIAEGYASIKTVKNNLIPCQISILVYASLTAYNNGEQPVSGIADFSEFFGNLSLSVAGYETYPTQDLLIGVVEEALELVYPTKIEVITL